MALGHQHRWARNLKNVALQKQNAICKTRAQYAKPNCAFELFKAHCAATINAKCNFSHINYRAQRTQPQLYEISKFLVR
jgi:hypothetical protein